MSYLWYWPAGGWNFEAWKVRHPWQPISSEQSGRRDWLPLLGRGEDREDWERQRPHWQQVMRDLLGDIPYAPPERLWWETLEERTQPGYTLRRLRYTLTADEWGYAWLLLPDEIGRRHQAVIALHQTVPQGKDEPIDLEDDASLPYGRELAERGFMILAPDAIGFGERRTAHPNARYHSADAFFAAHPEGSVLGKMAYDTSRAVDLLQTLPDTQDAPIGCIGHSHGGYGTLFAMLYDERIRAGVISCGISPLRTDPTPERWWRNTALIPRLGYYEGQIEQTPLDFHHLLALIAPRPLMVVAALNDSIFPNLDAFPHLLERARQVYRLYGAERELQRWVFHGAHRFPLAARTRAYQMLERALQ